MSRKPTIPIEEKFGSVRRDEVLPLREVGRRFGWRTRMLADVQKMGLRTVKVGRIKFVTGAEVFRFVEAMTNRPAGITEDTGTEETNE